MHVTGDLPTGDLHTGDLHTGDLLAGDLHVLQNLVEVGLLMLEGLCSMNYKVQGCYDILCGMVSCPFASLACQSC